MYAHAAVRCVTEPDCPPVDPAPGHGDSEGCLSSVFSRRRLVTLAATACIASVISGCSLLGGHSATPAATADSGTPAAQATRTPPTPLVVADPWHSGMPQLGIDVYWTGNGQDSDAVIRAKAERIIAYAIGLHANSISLTFPVYTYGITSDSLYANAVTTPSPAHVAIFLSAAAANHMRVTIRPVLNEDALVAQNANAWRGSIEPASTSAWFASYQSLLLPYARVAESGQAATFVIGTEFNSLEGDPGWASLISAVSSVYRGQLMYDENFDSFQDHDTNLPLSTFGVDAYPRFQLPDSASVGQLEQAWVGWLSSHSTSVLHEAVLSEVGIAAVSGAYPDPGGWLDTANLPIKPQIQANWYAAACRAFTADKLAGIYWWEVSFDANPASPAGFLSDRLTFLDRPAQQQISSCFASITASENGDQ